MNPADRSVLAGLKYEQIHEVEHTSIKTTEKHYAPWLKSRQTALEDAVKLAWA
jgi:hypothetical protein